MARRKVTEDTIADEIIARLGKEMLRDKWTVFALSNTNPEIENAAEYITNCEPELSEWIESLIPYMEERLNNTLIDDVIKDYFGEEFYRKNVVPF